MARRKNKHYDIVGGFVRIPKTMLDSKAWRVLSVEAKACLPLFLIKVHKKFDDAERYTEAFKFPYAEAERYRFHRDMFKQIIIDLESRGFITVERGASLKNLKAGEKAGNRFKLSRSWERYEN